MIFGVPQILIILSSSIRYCFDCYPKKMEIQDKTKHIRSDIALQLRELPRTNKDLTLSMFVKAEGVYSP